jgi:16S rRNA (cytosine967-C5)-methyltransferase
MNAQRESARAIAIDVLVRVDDGAYSNLVLPAALRRTALSERDRAFVTDLVYGTLRWQGRSDALIAAHLDRSLDKLDAPARAALRMGTYQLTQGVPPHAAVGETVTACAQRLPRARGLVNAVLRRVSEDPHTLHPPEGDDDAAIAARTSMPRWIVRAARARFGDEAERVLAAMNEPPMLTLRPNPLATTPEVLIDELQAIGATTAAGELATSAVRVRGAGDTSAIAAIRDGRATPQDEGSQAVIDVVDPQPGERILEIAAAPGGKSTAMAERVGPTGLVVSADIDAGRVGRIAQAAERLALSWCIPVVADGRALPVRGAFDRVLLDAPCSGLGVLRRRAEARWRITESDVADLAELQRTLLRTAAEAVAPGGMLIYSVCTWTGAETDAIGAWAAEELTEFEPVPPACPPWVPLGDGGLIRPLLSDGMYVLRLQRRPS